MDGRREPYIVTGPIHVPAGTTLTISPGVQVVAPAIADGGRGSLPISVEGALVAIGTAEAPIDFQRQDGPVQLGWRGLTVSGSATLAHVHIRDAEMGIYGAGVVDVKSSWLDGNDYGAYVSGTATFDRVVASGKMTIGIMVHGGVANITNSVFIGAGLDGVTREGGEVTIRNCTFNLNSTAIYGVTPDGMTIINTIIANNVRSALDGPSQSRDLTVPRLINSLIFGTTNYRYSLQPYDGGALVADPMFVGPSDLHLQPGSPCIDTGTLEGAPDHDFDDAPRPYGQGVDIGAFEWRPTPDAGADGGGNDAHADALPTSDATIDSSGQVPEALDASAPFDSASAFDVGAQFDSASAFDVSAPFDSAIVQASSTDASVDQVDQGAKLEDSASTSPSSNPVGTPVSSDGCGCRLAADSPARTERAGWLLMLLLAGGARRRYRASRPALAPAGSPSAPLPARPAARTTFV